MKITEVKNTNLRLDDASDRLRRYAAEKGKTPLETETALQRLRRSFREARQPGAARRARRAAEQKVLQDSGKGNIFSRLGARLREAFEAKQFRIMPASLRTRGRVNPRRSKNTPGAFCDPATSPRSDYFLRRYRGV